MERRKFLRNVIATGSGTLIIPGISVLAGCGNLLDVKPATQQSSADFWNEDNLRLAANDLYYSFALAYGSPNVDTQSVDYYGQGPNAVSDGTYIPPNTDNIWNTAYTNIRRANTVLENLDKVKGSQDVINRYAAEARFFRAYCYFHLLKRFGDVPLILKTLDLDDPSLYGPRTSRDKVADQITDDLLWAADHLPSKSSLVAKDKGRITAGDALGFLSTAALFEGTRSKYHNYGDPKTRLQTAQNAALKVIQSNQYKLFSDFLGIFEAANQNNSEVMLQMFYEEGVTAGTPGRGRGLIIDAAMVPTKYLADSFLCDDGLPIEYSPKFQGYSNLQSEFENRDPRMSQTIWEPGTPFQSGPLLPDLSKTYTGYWPKKPGDPLALTQFLIYNNYIIMRYAEVLLNYAEATYELSGSISDQDLDISINKLRDRVGMPHISNDFVNGNNSQGAKLDMKEEIRRERRVELAGEGVRYDDLMRWKTAENELPQAILGAKFQQSEYPAGTGKNLHLDSEGFIITQTSATRHFDQRQYLFPIPLQELALDTKMEQNPNW